MRCFLLIGFLFLGLAASAQDTPAPKPPTGLIQKSIFFGGGSYYVDEEQTQELFQLLDTIPNIELYQISIYSHTDNIGGQLYNKWLSEMRSQAALQKLIIMDIPLENISIKAFGQENPYFDNKKWEGKLLNRRVDIIFWPIVF
ncbi:OmpA family protein [Imperialibacter roseus]|uniref:OmpA family protein n=1 Tax=Imperialibacter roseus TaxID=1324217 RepID=A0ABZ0IUY6_9BACT|nr:OmpA family protein [Imperialibacter roseus]WOK08794.1 OmpA family protein [Imperialibacter roseus]|tara:strand:- start:152 stop:580 length:429 start_codon:yes stop_codon:yes gene_type:complete